MRHLYLTTIALGAAGFCAPMAEAQVRLDRADPTITEQSLVRPAPPPAERPVAPVVEAARPSVAASASGTPVTAVTVGGIAEVPASAFAEVIAPVLGRSLDRAELGALAGAVAKVVQARGYPFATASIEPQAMANGTLRVTVDPGRIDAVRVVGVRHAVADAILVRALASGRPVTQGALERALLLVADLPGVRVKDTKYVRQDGFGILLVTIVEDRASAFAQIDNRGSREVGPYRSTLLGNLRGLAGPGDELGVIIAQTPFQPDEFAFARARYAAPVGTDGSVLAVSGSIGRSNPGAGLKPLDVVGRSGDVAVSYARPLLRRRARSVWAGAELRAVTIRQRLSGIRLRDDRLATLTGSLNAVAALGGGTLRAETTAVAGLPLSGVSREGDLRTSRADGDGRFVTFGYQVDWARPIGGPVSVALASAAQIATRPLLATAEIGLGGPVFGRGYDYAERTGDNGIMASAELRADTGRGLPGVFDRSQFYAFVDGGRVSNWRGGIGGGSLASSGFGVRAGAGRLDGMIELAFPINADRFDTGNRSPRLSVRLSRVF